MTDRLKGKVALITGGARGIGGATVRAFAGEGAKLVFTDVNPELGNALAKELGPDSVFLEHDVTDEAGWQRVRDKTVERFGRIDILVNNAGIITVSGFLDFTREAFERVMAVNLTGTFLGIRAVGPVMLEQKKGSIVNISSADGISATNGLCAYTASKWAVRGLTKSAAIELGHKGVRVNSIHPGGIDTPLTNPLGEDVDDAPERTRTIPLGRMGRAEEVALACVYLGSDEASYCNGTELLIDGGLLAGRYYSFLPGAPEGMAG